MMKKKRKKTSKGGGRKLYLKPKFGKGASADWVGLENRCTGGRANSI
jgi:hypothetical protein